MSEQSDHDEFDDFDEEDEARAWFQREVTTRGLRIALETAISVCCDSSSTPQAKANASSQIMRAAGMFDRKDDDRRRKPIHEMSLEEMDREIRRLQKPPRRPRSRKASGSVFD
jgi:hypothetical protein